jgi:hypothetical protein
MRENSYRGSLGKQSNGRGPVKSDERKATKNAPGPIGRTEGVVLLAKPIF